jgi:hypothetical protein
MGKQQQDTDAVRAPAESFIIRRIWADIVSLVLVILPRQEPGVSSDSSINQLEPFGLPYKTPDKSLEFYTA